MATPILDIEDAGASDLPHKLLRRTAATRRDALAIPPTEPIGAPGVYNIGGAFYSDDLVKLTGISGRKEFRNMARDCHVAAGVLLSLEMLINNVSWEIQKTPPGSAASDDEDTESTVTDEDVDFLNEVLFEDMTIPFKSFISDVLSFLTYGWSYHEIIYKRRLQPHSKYDDGLYGLDRISLRPQLSITRFDSDEKGDLRGVFQSAARSGLAGQFYLPIERCLYFVAINDLNNIEGRSLLRGSYQNWVYVKNLYEIEAIGIERDLTGLPILKVPAQVLQDKSAAGLQVFNEWKQMAEGVRRNKRGSIVMPSDPIRDNEGNPVAAQEYTIELLGTGGQANHLSVTEPIERHLFAIAQSMLADFITIGQQASGSYALVKDKRSFFEVSITGWVNKIASVLNSKLIPDLWKLNGKDLTARPYIKPGSVREKDAEVLATTLSDLSRAGMPLFPDENLERHVRSIMDLPPRSQEAIEQQEQTQQMNNMENINRIISGFKDGAAGGNNQTGGKPGAGKPGAGKPGAQQNKNPAQNAPGGGKSGGANNNVGATQAVKPNQPNKPKQPANPSQPNKPTKPKQPK